MAVFCLSHDKYYDEVLLPYLLGGGNMLGQVSIVGRQQKGVTIDAFFAWALLQVAPSNDTVIVPEAPIRVLQQFGELIHTGR